MTSGWNGGVLCSNKPLKTSAFSLKSRRSWCKLLNLIVTTGQNDESVVCNHLKYLKRGYLVHVPAVVFITEPL